MSDIIVLAGQSAIENAGGEVIDFCGGRVDAIDATVSEILAPRTYSPDVVSIRDDMQVKGLTAREGVALAGRPTASVGFTNNFYKDLQVGNGNFSYEELALLEDEFGDIVSEYAEDVEIFMNEFNMAWTKMMIADRFNGPFENVCTGVSDPTTGPSDIGSDDTGPNDKNGENTSSDAYKPLQVFTLFTAAAAAAGLLFI